MKNYRGLIFSLVIAVVLSGMPAAAADTDTGGKPTPRFSAGPMLWYAWWSPVLKYFLTNTDTSRATVSKRFSMRDSSIIYGPAFSYRISDRWSMTAVFMFCAHGQYSAVGSAITLDSMFTPTATRVTANRIHRYDADLTFGYALNRYVRLFIGAKGQAFTFEGNYRAMLRIAALYLPLLGSMSARSVSAGIGCGVGVTVPLGAGFYFMATASGIAMPDEFVKIRGHLYRDRAIALAFGANATASFAYLIEKANVTVSLGGRYQLLAYALLKDDYSILGTMNTKGLNRELDQFYGLLLSVLFSF